jgi:tight adherence protein B
MSPLLIYIAAFVGVAALVGGVAFVLRGPSDSNVEDRLAMLTGSGAKQSKEGLLNRGVLFEPLEASQNFLVENIHRLINLKLMLEQADSSLTPSKFLTICGIFFAAGVFVPALVGVPIVFTPAVGVMLAFLPLFWLRTKRKWRFAKFAKQLPDALELIARALRAGHSLGSGFNLVAEEMEAPIGKEFSRVFEEQNLGIAMEDALENMSDRIPNLDLRFFCTAINLQRQTGGDLAEILDKIGYIVRERFKIWGQVQALTGEGRLSGIVLLALPPALFLAVYYLNPDYVMPLVTDPMGRKMLAGGVVMQLLGALVIRKIINIKV